MRKDMGHRGLLKTSKTGFAVFLLLALILLSVGNTIPVHMAKASGKTVKVGWFESSYYTLDKYGRRSGYAYEYQQKVASYTGWNYEYVEDSWPRLYEMLCEGEIDILADVSYTEERTQYMNFSSQPMGQEEYYLFVSQDDKGGISIEDISTIDNKKVGVNKGSLQAQLFLDWAEDNGVSPKLIELEGSEEESERLLTEGKIDAYVSLDSYGGFDNNGIIPVFKIGASDYFFAVNKSRQDLLKELDSALNQIHAENRYYNIYLQEKYLYGVGTSLYLSEEEKKWLEKHNPLRVGYRDNYLAYCDKDEETGELMGALAVFLEAASGCLQNAVIEFEPVAYPTTDDALDAMKAGEIDCVFPVSFSMYDGEKRGLLITSPQMESEMYAVMRRSDLEGYDPDKPLIVAVDEKNPNYETILLENFPHWEMAYYDTTEEGLKAISKGKADCILVSNYRVNTLSVAVDKYHLFPVSTGITMSSSFAMRKEDTKLCSILNKVTRLVPDSQINSALASYSYVKQRLTVLDFVKENLIGVNVFFVIIIGVFMFLFLRSRRSEKKALQSEQETQKAFSVIEQMHEEESIQLEEIASLNESLQAQIRALEESEESNYAKNIFLANMSHEIRTPISTILGMNEIILRDSKEESVQKCSDNIRVAGNRLLGMMSDILDFAKLEAGKMVLCEESYSLRYLIGDLLNMVQLRADKKGLDIVLDIDPHLPCELIGDEIRVKQVITNLLTNAIKFTESGKVTLAIALLSSDGDTATIHVAVKDTGIGIREEEKRRLFESFGRLDAKRTRTIEGVGLGLTITRELLKMMGSRISVESTYNKGSVFSFDLKQKISDSAEIGDIDKKSLSHIEGEHTDGFTFVSPESHILIVDDTQMNLEVISGLLKPTQIKIDVAHSGAECIEMFSSGQYDLVFLDYRMPHIDGIETLAVLKEKDPEKTEAVPIISLTANALQGDKEMMLDAGFTDYLAKPVKVLDMNRMLIKYLPGDKVVFAEEKDEEPKNDPLEGIPMEAFSYPWLDPKEGVEYCGSAFVYIKALEIFVNKVDGNTELINKCVSDGDIERFTITVHSLKSMSLSIGIASFSEQSRQLEFAGKRGDSAYIARETPGYLKRYHEIKRDLQVILEHA